MQWLKQALFALALRIISNNRSQRLETTLANGRVVPFHCPYCNGLFKLGVHATVLPIGSPLLISVDVSEYKEPVRLRTKIPMNEVAPK
jgi:hypothetical protein